jgi:hypothetical protein
MFCSATPGGEPSIPFSLSVRQFRRAASTQRKTDNAGKLMADFEF